MQEVQKFLLIFSCLILITNSDGILCYKCTATREPNKAGPPPCTEFDWSERFEVECPKSTLCMKTSSTKDFGKNEVTIVERDCAPQKTVVHSRGETEWITEEKISSAYSKGCETLDVDNPKKYCFCGLSLCNGSDSNGKIFTSHIILHIAGLMLYIWANFHI